MLNAGCKRTQESFLAESASLRFSSPLFSELARRCARDNDFLALGASVRPDMRIGLFILLVAQYLVLITAESEIAQYLPNLTASPRPVENAFPAFREFCLARRTEMVELLTNRTLNTNLVERAACIVPAIRYVARLVQEPLTVVEVGCSAGLNLLFDEYSYDYGSMGRLGPSGALVRLQCTIAGGVNPPLDLVPEVRERLGIDLVAVDPSDPQDRLWMEAMLCPEWKTERAQLRNALSVRAGKQLRVVIGDALTALPSIIHERTGPLCVLHSYCLQHWSSSAKRSLEELLCQLSETREIHRLGIEVSDSESPSVKRERLQRLTEARIPLQQKSMPSQIEHASYAAAKATSRLIAHADGFGKWLYWRPPA